MRWVRVTILQRFNEIWNYMVLKTFERAADEFIGNIFQHYDFKNTLFNHKKSKINTSF